MESLIKFRSNRDGHYYVTAHTLSHEHCSCALRSFSFWNGPCWVSERSKVFRSIRKKTAEEVLSQLTTAYKADCPSKSAIYLWIAEFKRGRESVHDDAKAGRPTEIDSDTISKKCENIIRTERRITTKELAILLNVSDWKARDVLKSCGIRKLFFPFCASISHFGHVFGPAPMLRRKSQPVPWTWTTVSKQQCHRGWKTFDLYHPESGRESSEWCFVNEFAPRKLWSGSSRRRCLMFPVFWGSQCVIKVDFADKSVKFNNEYYASLICETRAERSKPRGSPLWLSQGNASIHTSQVTKKTIQEANFHLLQHPLYSPDLAPSDFWLFRHLKKHLRDHQFSSASCVQQATENFQAAQPLTFFQRVF